MPILFGTEKQQALLLRLYLEGPVPLAGSHEFRRLLVSGLVGTFQRAGATMVALNHRHPRYEAFLAVLADLADGSPPAVVPKPRRLTVGISAKYPLGDLSYITFRILVRLVHAGTPLSADALIRQLPDIWYMSIREAVARLVRAGVIGEGKDGRYALSPGVPKTFSQLVLAIAEYLATNDPRFAPGANVDGPRPSANMSAADGAPRLFGTDVRLRNLMGLAVHGPLHIRELRKVTGANHLHRESRDDAPFGRGGLVRTWETEDGEAAALDAQYPLALPLRRLLAALEATYPLPPLVTDREAPTPPRPAAKWRGDRNALFGSDIPTTILTSIGVHGWTFEALCVELCIGHDRYNVKRAMRRLEDEEVLQGDRERGPGMNVRVVTIADGFVAKAELDELLRAYVEAWPQMKGAVQRAFEKIARERPRGKAHLLKRGLWPYD